MSERLEHAIANFGQPSYQYKNEYKKIEAFWFGHMLYLDSYGKFSKLKIKKKYFFFGKRMLYREGYYEDEVCGADVQAKWEIHGLDEIILG